MRENLFRGKRLGIGEWVEGYFFKAKLYRSDDELSEFITVPRPEVKGLSSDDFLVDPDTVGQFTGLTDKNGTKIFEGDIVKYGDHLMVVVWYEFLASFMLAFSIDGNYHETMSNSHIYLEVIGNIHDNPKLLEVEDGK